MSSAFGVFASKLQRGSAPGTPGEPLYQMRWTLALPSDTAWCRSQTGQWCPVGSAPGTPCTMDSSSLGALVVLDPMLQLRRSRCRGRRALACARRRNDVTRCNSTDIPQRSLLCIMSFIKPEVHSVSQHRQMRTEPRF